MCIGKDKRLHDFFADKVLYPVEWRIFVFFNILFRFQFRDCEGNTLQLYCVPNSEKSHSYMSIERVLRG